MIIGIGLDIIDNRRIKKTIDKFDKKFKKRCFSDKEIKLCESRNQAVNSFAKRYAAKEACAKALGTGLARGVFWKDIEVSNDKYGKPLITLYNKALSRLKILTKSECKIELSLSDEVDYSIANVIIFNNE
jgi:holo-[acyl-carrier protein] synthase